MVRHEKLFLPQFSSEPHKALSLSLFFLTLMSASPPKNSPFTFLSQKKKKKKGGGEGRGGGGGGKKEKQRKKSKEVKQAKK